MPEQMIPIPARTSPSNCRKCSQLIYWVSHPSSGRPHPVSIEHEDAIAPGREFEGKGISHFADCVNADEFRRAR
jgi:hypothetical protein